MKYFTKYLPVEGEIKEGDKIILEGKIHQIPDKEHAEGANLCDHKKVKLFLCSRDFVKGEKVYCLEEEQENRNRGLKEGDSEWVNPWCVAGECKACIKVLGEISPDALSYVKEGDEFDENQINWMYQPPYDEIEYYFLSEFPTFQKLLETRCIEYQRRYHTPMIAIKGPCGHFH